jgi:hypothetical protein
MGSPYNNLLRRVEDAFQSYIEAENRPGATVHIYRTLDAPFLAEKVQVPCVIVTAYKARPLFDGVSLAQGFPPRTVFVRLIVRTAAEGLYDGGTQLQTAREHHDTIVGQLADLLSVADLAAQLDAQDVVNLAIDDSTDHEESISVSGNHIETELVLEVTARSTAE